MSAAGRSPGGRLGGRARATQDACGRHGQVGAEARDALGRRAGTAMAETAVLMRPRGGRDSVASDRHQAGSCRRQEVVGGTSVPPFLAAGNQAMARAAAEPGLMVRLLSLGPLDTAVGGRGRVGRVVGHDCGVGRRSGVKPAGDVMVVLALRRRPGSAAVTAAGIVRSEGSAELGRAGRPGRSRREDVQSPRPPPCATAPAAAAPGGLGSGRQPLTGVENWARFLPTAHPKLEGQEPRSR